MYLFVIFIPLINTIIIQLFGFLVNKTNLLRLVCFNMLVCLAIAYFMVYEVILCGGETYIKLADWIVSTTIHINWGYIFDSLSCFMLVVILSISTAVHIYSLEYMGEDPFVKRFISYLSLFTFFMIILVTADNLLQMFVGWEGVGLCSYLLINFWFQRIQANKAAIKAMIINRIGDFALALGIFIFFYLFKSINYATIFATANNVANLDFVFFNNWINVLSLGCLFIFIGCMGKSAQIGLHTWLPDAMEGPTPVSALIHAATMVTAGVFLIIRCSSVFENKDSILVIITFIGAFTAFLAGTIGLTQNDLKRVIAYSTCSQLGYMFLVAGLSGYQTSFFHLYNHAFFKALLFLSAGSVIHAVSDEQDMRKMGGLSDFLIFTSLCMVVGSLALEGFPFSTGFYSKDAILEITNVQYNMVGNFASLLAHISVLTTVFYSTRSFFYTFVENPLGFKKTYLNSHESNYVMALPLLVLVILTVYIGLYSKDIIVGAGSNYWADVITVKSSNWTLFAAENLENYIKDIPLLLGFISAFVASLLYTSDFLSFNFFKWKTTFSVMSIYNFLNRKWYFDKVFNEWISQNILDVSYKHIYQNLDRGIVEKFGPTGISLMLYNFTLKTTQVTFSFIYHYTYLTFISIVGLCLVLINYQYIIFNINFELIILMIIVGIYTTYISKNNNLKK